MQSCLYFGRLRHRRFRPRAHAFRYRLFMVYLDLGELDTAFRDRWLWSVNQPNLVWFRRADYLGAAEIPLDEAVRGLVAERTGRRPTGPVRMLTHLRHFGYCFNPVTFYYCFSAEGERLETIVAEITNTPWDQRHSYVLSADLDEPRGPVHRYRFPKRFHVSPFFPMDIDYDWRFCEPGPELFVHMRLDRHGEKVFDATLEMERREFCASQLARALLRFPFMPLQAIAEIYWQAARLKLKRIPFHDHPDSSTAADPSGGPKK